MSKTEGSRVRRPPWRRIAFIALSLFLLYALAGFLLLPWQLRPRLERLAASLLDRKMTLQRLRINPFAWSASAEGLQITDRDGAPLLRWDRLYVNFEPLSSLFRREWVFREIHLAGAGARLVMQPDASLNIDDILKSFETKPETTPPPQRSALPVLRVGRLRVEDTTLSYVDRSAAEIFTTTLGPIRIDLRDFTTRSDERNAYSFRGRSEKAEGFSWRGQFMLGPLRSEGDFTFDGVLLNKYRPYYRGTFPFDIRNGTADARAHYRFAWGPGRREVKVADASVVIRDLKLSEHGKDEIAVDAPLTEVAGGNLDFFSGAVSVGRLATKGGTILLRQRKDGQVNLLNMILPFFAESPSPPSTPAPSLAASAPAAGPSPDLKVSLSEVEFSDYTVDAEDLTPPRPVRVRLDQIHLKLQGVDNVPSTTSKASLDLRWNGEGTLHVEGDLSLVGLKGDLAVKVEGIDVTPVDPYVEPVLDLRVRSGSFSAEGKVHADLQDAKHPQLTFAGDLRMDDFTAVDGPRREDFLSWKSVRMSKLDYSHEENRMRIGGLEVAGAEAVLARAPDGSINLFSVLRMPQALAEGEDESHAAAPHAADPAPPSAAPPAPASPAPAAPMGDTRITRARIRNSRIRVIDRTMTPPVTLALTRIDGALAGLSSRPGARADVRMSARFDDRAPVTLEGKVDPLGADAFTDLALLAKGIDLGPMGPYSARYLGYALDRARLDLDMRYRLENRVLQGTNVFIADPFLLGAKTESPDATSLPVRLGLALLRDRQGVIRLEVPVEGSLDDPKFRLGRVILRALVNVFTKLVTSPFTLLARAFAGKEDVDLSVIDFPPGEATLGADARERLDSLARALGERPDLGLGIAGGADAAMDTGPLKHGKLDGMIRFEKWKSLRRRERETTPAENVTVTPGEYPKFLKAAWKTFREDHPPGKDESGPETPEETEDWMLARIEVGPADLTALAGERARAVRDYLLAAGIAEARLLRNEGPATGSARVSLELQ